MKKHAPGISSNNDDASIQDQIMKLLHDDSSIDVSKMTVEVNDGVVILKGNADTEKEKEKIQLLCASISAVKKVENQLVIGPAVAHDLAALISSIVADDKADKKK